MPAPYHQRFILSTILLFLGKATTDKPSINNITTTTTTTTRKNNVIVPYNFGISISNHLKNPFETLRLKNKTSFRNIGEEGRSKYSNYYPRRNDDKENKKIKVKNHQDYDEETLSYLPEEYYPIVSPEEEPYYDSDPVPLTNSCYCPRSYGCENPSNTFFNLIRALGQNLWALTRLIAISSLPFVLPLIALKVIIIPLKILKLIKLIKLFLKFFVILPLVMRIISPILAQLNLPNIFHDLFSPYQHQQQQNNPDDEADEDEGRKQQANTTNYLKECTSRVACQVGVYLSETVRESFSKNFINFIIKKSDDYRRKNEQDKKKDKALEAFLNALSRNRLTRERCDNYGCWILDLI